MKVINKIIKLKTKDYLEFIDLTEEVHNLFSEAKIKTGSVIIYSRHTTLAIRINEKEKGFHQDFKDFLSKLAPKDSYYRHNDMDIRTENLVCSPGATDCLNGHSHCAHMLMSTSETIPVISGELMLGVWQRVFAVELDSARSREVIIQVIGT